MLLSQEEGAGPKPLFRKQTLLYDGPHRVVKSGTNVGKHALDAKIESLTGCLPQSQVKAVSNKSDSVPPFVPAWIKHSGQVLRFCASYKRKWSETEYTDINVKIHHFLEDHTTEIISSEGELAGKPLVKRGTMSATSSGRHTSFSEALFSGILNLGSNVEIYGITYRVIDADEFTRHYMKGIGCQLGPSVRVPGETNKAVKQSESTRSCADRISNYLLGISNKKPRKLVKDATVLQFLVRSSKGRYDDHHVHGAPPRHFQMNYYTEDGTVEMFEIYPDTGDTTQRFMSRHALKPGDVDLSGQTDACTDNSLRICPQDLMLGSVVRLRGEEFEVYEASKMTQIWMKVR